MNKYNLVSYALDFVSFLLRRKEIANKIDRIILFGSVARGDFDRDSDVDLFIDSSASIEKDATTILNLYNKSKQKEIWELRGIKNAISLKTGRIAKWKLIKRSVLTDGLVLYGKYEEAPENLQHFALFTVSFEKLKRNDKVLIWRKLYGYKQKIGKKTYETPGFIKEFGGMKLEKGVMLIPIKNSHEFSSLLRHYKLNYKIFEIWSDSF